MIQCNFSIGKKSSILAIGTDKEVYPWYRFQKSAKKSPHLKQLIKEKEIEWAISQEVMLGGNLESNMAYDKDIILNQT